MAQPSPCSAGHPICHCLLEKPATGMMRGAFPKWLWKGKEGELVYSTQEGLGINQEKMAQLK